MQSGKSSNLLKCYSLREKLRRDRQGRRRRVGGEDERRQSNLISANCDIKIGYTVKNKKKKNRRGSYKVKKRPYKVKKKERS